MAQYSYKYGNNLYLNITNRCMMACPYCIKQKWSGDFRGNSLKLDKEPTVEQVIQSIGDPTIYGEIIFCGYGDALIRLSEVIEISKWLKNKNMRVRINTAGLANRYYGKAEGLGHGTSHEPRSSTPTTYCGQSRPNTSTALAEWP